MKSIAVRLALCATLATMVSSGLYAAHIQVEIKNVGPEGGLWIMRPWIGLHDGGFPTFRVGEPAPSGVQHIAEDGVTGDVTNTSLLSGPGNACTGVASVYTMSSPCMNAVFSSYANGSQQVSIGGPTIPGATLVYTFSVDPTNPNSKYLSYLVMIIPSNDAFFGTDSGHPIRLYDSNGNFNGGKGSIHQLVLFRDILDAGTEVNTENHTDTAFFGQAVAGTGTHPDTNPVVHRHDPFTSSIVDGSNIYPGSQWNHFNWANFQGPVAEVTITELP